MSRPDRNRLVPIAGALIAAAVTIAGWLVLPEPPAPAPESDWPRFYRPVARSIADGRGWSLSDGTPAPLSYPPGYPFLVAASFRVGDPLGIPERAAVRGLNLLFIGMGGALVASTIRAVAGAKRALAGALLWSLYPPFLWMTSQPLSDVPFTAVLAAVAATWHVAAETSPGRRRRWLSLGVLTGLAALLRPIAILLGGVLALLALISPAAGPDRRRRATAAALLLAGWMAALLPWQVWASARTGRFVFLCDGGTPSVSDGLTWAVRDKGYRPAVPLPDDLRAAMEGFDSLGGGPSLAKIAAEVRRQAEERPLGLLKLAGWKVVRPLWGTDSGRREIPVAAVNLSLLALYGLALRLGLPDQRAASRLAVAGILLGLSWAMASAVLPIARYLAPPLALICGLLPLALPPRRGAEAVRPEP